jgi:PTH2 family peptidyl-tRNA hydrolase
MGFKQAIIVRTDLKMGKGKLASQAAHASVSAMRKAEKESRKAVEEWEREGQKKIVLKVGSEGELLRLFEVMKKEIPCALVKDAGKTQLEPGTATCFGAGPAEESLIDKYCKGLKLL